MADQFKALREALQFPITPLPWKLGPLFDNDGTPERIIAAMSDAACVAVTLEFGDNNPGMRDSNAALIVALANAAPALLAEFDALGERLQQVGQEARDNRSRRVLELEAEVEALRKKSARYDWLRAQPNNTDAPRIDVVYWTAEDDASNAGEGLRMEALDAAIDAALGATARGTNHG